MNRAARRRRGKDTVKLQKLSPEFQEKKIEELLEQTKQEGIVYTTNALLAILSLSLHDKWGWGHVRVVRLLEQIQESFEAVQEGYVKIEDVQKVVLEKLKIEFK